MITVLCGLQDEANIFKGVGDLQVLCGATQRDRLAALTTGNCKALVSAGCAGALAPDLTVGALTVATSVILLDGTTYQPDLAWLRIMTAKTNPDLRRVFSCPTEQCATPGDRAKIRAALRADVVDEESWAVGELAHQRGLPFLVLRAISDTADQTILPHDAQAQRPDGSEDIGPVIGDVFADPVEAFREADGFNRSLDTMRAAFKALGPDFGFGARS